MSAGVALVWAGNPSAATRDSQVIPVFPPPPVSAVRISVLLTDRISPPSRIITGAPAIADRTITATDTAGPTPILITAILTTATTIHGGTRGGGITGHHHMAKTP